MKVMQRLSLHSVSDKALNWATAFAVVLFAVTFGPALLGRSVSQQPAPVDYRADKLSYLSLRPSPGYEPLQPLPDPSNSDASSASATEAATAATPQPAADTATADSAVAAAASSGTAESTRRPVKRLVTSTLNLLDKKSFVRIF